MDMVQELPMGVGSVAKVDGDSQVKFFILIIILQPTKRGRPVMVEDGETVVDEFPAVVSGRIDPACDGAPPDGIAGIVLGFLIVSTAFSVLLWAVVGLQQHPAVKPRGPGGNIAMTL